MVDVTTLHESLRRMVQRIDMICRFRRSGALLVLDVRSAVQKSGDHPALRLGGRLSREQRLKEESQDFGAKESEGRESDCRKQKGERCTTANRSITVVTLKLKADTDLLFIAAVSFVVLRDGAHFAVLCLHWSVRVFDSDFDFDFSTAKLDPDQFSAHVTPKGKYRLRHCHFSD
jgi:hypothetical protein